MSEEKSPLGQYVSDYQHDDKLYRILRFEHLVTMLEKKILKIPRICSWEDTYENYIYKSRFKIGGRDFGVLFKDFNYQERFFGLCWSYTKESDALWKIYSPDRQRVKIKVNLGKLITAIQESLERQKITLFFGCGRIVYVSKENLNFLFSQEMFLNKGNDTFLTHDGLFIKRIEFDYENEFRTIVISSLPLSGINFIEIDVDPIGLIEEVVFDPRMEEDTIQKYSHDLDKLGIKNFSKSTLYDTVDFELVHDAESIKNLKPLIRY